MPTSEESKLHRKTMREHGFQDEDLDDLKAAFQLFDKNNDGTITQQEFEEVLKTMGLEPSREQLKAILKEADTNGDGEIDFNEFVKMMLNQMENKGSVMQSFEDDDFITVAELKHVMLALGEDLSENDLQDMIKEADVNGDGRLNYKEFVAMIVESIT
mmetsp:Transcript_29170/g.51238  ORF Transcript_29170/g.51238 Transcript_29170/m.51238 type:complete len:158 (-) Transcript_29170:355-828(-)|eukprot:CAMPEP_0197525514 /NCGR_PEP_ID=MMETSP1318-20131121/12847_1 /TAXON_ID=552666 /ORGANISM="Partenskyella glossopodia, Strain RCC365" /LENGTH=157 /DNA_ID=CAMNT_0043079027 /DNA_START=51 /DNA_END=524 /DNA_ORIENTATION=+